MSRRRRSGWGIKRLLQPKSGLYERQPIMITRNDYDQNLFNGDIGVVMQSKDRNLAGYFEGLVDDKGEPKPVPVSLLPPHETAFATTVHKAQGSEFDNLLIVLPPKHTPLISKELLYTTLTRVKPAWCSAASAQSRQSKRAPWQASDRKRRK